MAYNLPLIHKARGHCHKISNSLFCLKLLYIYCFSEFSKHLRAAPVEFGQVCKEENDDNLQFYKYNAV